MKSIKIILAIFSAILFWNCASNRGYQDLLDELEKCKVEIVENAVITDSVTRVKKIKFRRMGGRCFTELGAELYAKKEMCNNGWSFATLYNIEKPNFFSGRCYLADIDIYKDSVSHYISEIPIKKLDTVFNQGIAIMGNFDIGSAIAGDQEDPGLDPKPSVNKMEFGVLIHYLYNSIGAEIGYDFYGSSSSSKENYEPVELYNYSIFRAGLIVTMWKNYYLSGLRKIDLTLGPNFTVLKLDDEYWNLANTPFVVRNPGSGNGIGFYAKLNYRTVNKFGFYSSIGMKYEYEGPSLDAPINKLDAHKIQMDVSIGYKFKSTY